MDILLNTNNREVVNSLINYLEKQTDLHVNHLKEPYIVEILNTGFLYKITDDLLRFVYIFDLYELLNNYGETTTDIKNSLIIFNDFNY